MNKFTVVLQRRVTVYATDADDAIFRAEMTSKGQKRATVVHTQKADKPVNRIDGTFEEDNYEQAL